MQKIHFKAPECWINDPNGFIWYKGQYHLFYQCFPYSTNWGRMHWGHAVSSDLVNWEVKGIALYPSKTNDRSGCFSGSAIEYNGKMYIYYTGINYEVEDPENINVSINDSFIASQMMITSDDGLKFDNIKDKKTVIPPIKESEIGSYVHTRDPKVWKGNDGNWYMILGSTVNHTGRVLFYKSSDLLNWKYMNYASCDNMGWMWECPDYFEVNGNGVLIFSPMDEEKGNQTVCTLAEFNEENCDMKIREDLRYLDHGLDLYAPQSTTDENGNRVVIAWVRMPEAVNDSWNGMMCIPRIVEVENDRIYFRPHPNVRNSFTKEIDSPAKSDASGYMVRTSLENGESLNIGGYIIKRENDKIITDRTAVFPVGNFSYISETPEIKEGKELEIFVDENIIEIYVNNGEYVLTNVVYNISKTIEGKNYSLYAAE